MTLTSLGLVGAIASAGSERALADSDGGYDPNEAKERENSMAALSGKDYGKTRMRFSDYVLTESGLQFKDLRDGKGPSPKKGDQVVVDWDGYTIGYYGRIFEARNKAKGGSFEGNERGFFRFRVGENEVGFCLCFFFLCIARPAAVSPRSRMILFYFWINQLTLG